MPENWSLGPTWEHGPEQEALSSEPGHSPSARSDPSRPPAQPVAPPPVVLPEGVPLDLVTAHVGSRLVAFGIDVSLQLMGIIVSILAGSFLSGAVGHVALGIDVLAFYLPLAWIVGYWLVFETATGGRTPGLKIMGLRVRTSQGAPVRFRHVAVRTLLGLLELYLLLGIPAMVSITLSKRNQRLGDLAAGTIVVHEHHDTKALRVVTFRPPPAHSRYAQSLDVRGVRAGEYAVVRSLLLRAPQLRPAARVAKTTEIATQLAPRVWPPPVPGAMSAEDFLVCVAVAMQRTPQRPSSSAT